MQELRTKRHVISSLHLHLVFITKYRGKVLTQKMYERMHVRTPAGGTTATNNSIETGQQPERSFFQDVEKGIPRTAKVLLERRIMVTKLFYCFLWGSTSGNS